MKELAVVEAPGLAPGIPGHVLAGGAALCPPFSAALAIHVFSHLQPLSRARREDVKMLLSPATHAFLLLWSLTAVFQPMGEVSQFKPRSARASLAFFCNLNYAVCPKRSSVIRSRAEDFISPLASLYRAPDYPERYQRQTRV